MTSSPAFTLPAPLARVYHPYHTQLLPTSITPTSTPTSAPLLLRPPAPAFPQTQPRASYQYGSATPRSGGSGREEQPSSSSSGSTSGSPKFKFDPTSETNAFGRDPKKETEFWMQSARDVLASDEVRDAIDKFMQSGADNLTDEQRAYNEFIRKMDADKAAPDDDSTTQTSESQ